MNYSIKLLEEKLIECERNLAWYTGKSCRMFEQEKRKRIEKLEIQIPDLKQGIDWLKMNGFQDEMKGFLGIEHCVFHSTDFFGKCYKCGIETGNTDKKPCEKGIPKSFGVVHNKDFCKTGNFHIIEPNGKCENCGMTYKEILE